MCYWFKMEQLANTCVKAGLCPRAALTVLRQALTQLRQAFDQWREVSALRALPRIGLHGWQPSCLPRRFDVNEMD